MQKEKGIFFRIVCIILGLGITACIVASNRAYPIMEGRYCHILDSDPSGIDSIIHEYLPGHLYHVQIKREPGCIMAEHKGRWHVSDEEDITYLIDSVATRDWEECDTSKAIFRWETRSANYNKVRDISENAFYECEGARDCTQDSQYWYKFEKIR